MHAQSRHTALCVTLTLIFKYKLFFQDILDWGVKIVPHWETLRRKAEHCYILTMETLARVFTSIADPLHLGTDPDPGIRASD
jgi:hypothetical protein